MVAVNVDFEITQEEPVEAEFELTPDVTYEAMLEIGTPTNKHNELTNRDLADQHPISAITGLRNELDTLSGQISGNHQEITNHVTDKNNPHEVTKAQVGLGNADNTSDLNKPLSYAAIEALNGKQAVIPDLSTIRENASTALQPGDNVSELTNDAGYITSAAIPTNYVTTNTTQTITGEKVFSGILNIPAGKTYIIAGNGGAKLGYFTYDIDGFSNITLQTMTASNRDINFKTNNSGKVKYKGKEIAIKEDIPTAVSQLTNDSDYQTGTEVSNSIATETTNRENADINLQNQIDAITASSDVTDIVGTYAELQAYDTTDLPPNSIIKVLQDESRSDETTYYRWVITGGVGAWVLIGEEGPYYTKGEADAQFVPQTRTVNSKALSSNITLTASDVGALPDSTVIPTVNDATLTIQKNGTSVGTFTANASSNVTANITVPTDTSDLTNSAGFITGITSGDVTTALGYTPADNSDVSAIQANYVTTNTNQTITADKTFGNPVTFNQTTTFNTGVSQFYNGGYRMWKYKMASGNTYEDQSYFDSSNNFLGSFRVFDTGVASFLSFSETKTVSPTEDTTSSTQIDTVGARNTKLADYVTTNTAQTITGYKTVQNDILFTGDTERVVKLKNSTADALTAPSSDLYVGTISTRDKNDKQITNIRSAILSTGASRLTYNVRNYSEGNKHIQGVFRLDAYSSGGSDMKFSVSNNGSGDTRTATNYCLSSVTNSTTETRLACQGWVNNASTATNVVHRSGAETITGNKTFSGANIYSTANNPMIYTQTGATKGTNPASMLTKTDWYVDSTTTAGDTKAFASRKYTLNTSGVTGQEFYVYKNEANSTAKDRLAIYYHPTNGAYTYTPTPTEDNTTSNQIDTVGARNTKINSVLQSLMPTGTVLPYGGSSAPTGFLLCDGSAVSRTDYADLYAVIGDTYGSGDGSTTFNLPNLSTAVLPSSSTVSVVGNGNALGLTDDLSSAPNAQMVVDKVSGLSGQNTYSAQWSPTQPLAVGTVASSYGKAGTEGKGLGVSQDPDYSGLTGSITGVTLNYIIRT